MSKTYHKFNQKVRSEKMVKTIEISDLTEDEAKIIEEFVNFLKARRKEKPKKREEITFRSWPLKVKGKLTREEIYGYL